MSQTSRQHISYARQSLRCATDALRDAKLNAEKAKDKALVARILKVEKEVIDIRAEVERKMYPQSG